MGRPQIDIAGRIFGRLTVVERVDARAPDGSVQWLCKCACGSQTIVRRCNLPRTRSCGCYGREVARAQMRDRQFNIRGLMERVKRLERIVEEQRLQLDALAELVREQGRRAT